MYVAFFLTIPNAVDLNFLLKAYCILSTLYSNIPVCLMTKNLNFNCNLYLEGRIGY